MLKAPRNGNNPNRLQATIKKKAVRRGGAIKAENREQKAIEKLKWIHREKLKPVRKNIDD